MKTMKKLLCVGMAAALCVTGLAACGGGSGKNYTANNTEYFIGATGPLTGDASAYGISVQRGAELAIDEINEEGGLNGTKFKFEIKDDAATADKAATGYTALYEDGMQISIGSVTSGSCASFASSAVNDNVLLLTPSASAANVIATGDNAFRVCFGDPQQGTIAANTLTEKYKKIGVIYDTSDTYSSGIFDAFEAELKDLGKEKDTDYVVYTFDKDSNKDFSTQVGALKSADCDVIFLPIYYTEAGLIAKAAAKNDYNVDIFGCDGLDGVVDQIDDSVKATIQYITPFDINSTDPEVAAFVEAFKAKYNDSPDQFAADGYDAVMILYNAMKAADVNDVTISASDLCDIVKDVLTSGNFTYSGITGKNMTWTTEGSCNKDANIVTISR